MKKLFTLALIGLYFGAYAQLPVSQTAEKKKVILEEFTGKTCGFCPQGHKIASDMKAADPDNVFLINVHTGTYAQGTPNYRTPFGPDLANQSGLTGYPAGTVNRHVFSGSNTALSRNAWASSGNTIKTQNAYVNVALNASVDLNTRILTVDVEAYYTASAPNASNFINVAITQDDIHGPQSGASGNPDMIDDDGNYIHNHMLRHLITGQWGEEITTVSQGSLIQKSYTYTLPATIGDVDVDLTKLHIIAFVTETHQEIINGNGVEPTLTGLTNNLEAQAISAEVPETSCKANFEPKMTIRNWGNTTITSMKIEYSANDLTPQVYDWTGSIAAGLTETISLPALIYNSEASNEIKLKIAKVNGGDDEVLTNNELTATVLPAPEYQTTTMTLTFNTDQYSGGAQPENAWKLFDASNTMIQEATFGSLNSDDSYSVTLNLPNYDCYKFEFYDAFGDGMGANGANKVKLDVNGTTVFEKGGSFKILTTEFATVDADGNGNGNPIDNVTDIISIKDDNIVSNFNVFPNPATNFVNVNVNTNNNETISVELVDVLGKTISVETVKNSLATFNTSKINAGIYMVNVISNGKSIASSTVIVK